MARFKMDGFSGTVCLKQWFADPLSGRNLMGITGTARILEARDVMEFDPGANEANWVARIEGPTTTYNFPGCQVRCVIDHPDSVSPASHADFLVAP